MQWNDTVRTLLTAKQPGLYSIRPTQNVYDALSLMAERDIGALAVLENDRLVGIFSERDYARKLVLMGRMSRETPVSEVMTAPVIFVTPEHTVGECMQIITGQRIRHLPVLQREVPVAMISIGDLVNWMLRAQQETIRQLEAYIAGTPG